MTIFSCNTTKQIQKGPKTEELFLHETRDILFTLVVDDFGIKYTRNENVNHLIESVRKKCPFQIDWDTKQYIRMHLKWDYDNQTIRVNMKGYVEQALKEFEHYIPKRNHYGPSKINHSGYGQTMQYAKIDHSVALNPKQIKFLQ